MSIWTHVAAIFRIDGIQAFGQPDFEDIFGKELHWEDPFPVWKDACEHPENYLPAGSEGSLEKSVWINPNKSCLAAYTVSVFGDLRDYNDIESVERWFDECCRRAETIRQAVITIECDNGETLEKIWKEDAGA